MITRSHHPCDESAQSWDSQCAEVNTFLERLERCTSHGKQTHTGLRPTCSAPSLIQRSSLNSRLLQAINYRTQHTNGLKPLRIRPRSCVVCRRVMNRDGSALASKIRLHRTEIDLSQACSGPSLILATPLSSRLQLNWAIVGLGPGTCRPV